MGKLDGKNRSFHIRRISFISDIYPSRVPRLIAIVTAGVIALGAIICLLVDLLMQCVNKAQERSLLDGMLLFG
jgi:hypothetical protein